MADVTGQFGNLPVQLNNAATESTLRELLAAVQGMGGLGAAAKTAQVATTAGINNANTQLQQLSDTSSKTNEAGKKLGQTFGILHNVSDDLVNSFQSVDKAIGPFVGKLISGTAKLTDFYGALSQLPGILGVVASVFQKVAGFQQENLEAYQKLTNAGVNFGGSLSQIRQSALNTYMSFEQFQKVITTNSDTLSKMGGSANSGALAFVKLSNTLLTSEIGDNLRSLGFTTEQVNEGMLNYIAVTGGRTRNELKNTQDIMKGTTNYLEQLDRLADVTGKSREQQEKELKEAMFQADVQQTMARMTVAEREAFKAAMQEAGNLMGKGGQEIVLAQAQGRAVTGEAGKMLTAIAGPSAEAARELQRIAKEFGPNSKEFKDASNKIRVSMQDSMGRIPATVFSVNDSFKLIGDASKRAAQDQMSGLTTLEALEQAEKDRLVEIEKRKKSEATAAVEAEKAIQQAGQSLNTILKPAIDILTPIVYKLAKGFSDIIITLAEYKNTTLAITAAIIAYIATQKILDAQARIKAARVAAEEARETAQRNKDIATGKIQQKVRIAGVANVFVTNWPGGGRGGRGGRGGGGRGGRGGRGGATRPPTGSTRPPTGTPPPMTSGPQPIRPPGSPPMTSGPQPIRPPGSPPVPSTAPTTPRVPSGGSVAANSLKAAGVVGTIASLFMLNNQLSEIDKKKAEREKEIGKEKAEAEAKKEKGGAIGETGGGIAGGLAGAAAGAAIGSIVPVVGTAIGGLIGGIVGGFGGGWLGKSAGEAIAGSKDLPKMAAGGIVSTPTQVLAGEAGPEAIIPLTQFENLRTELQTLNKQSAEMIRYMRETAEYTKRTVDATKSLSGDLFKF